MQRKILARGQPVFLSGFECFLRLTDDAKLIVAKKPFQRLLHTRQLGGNALRLGDVLRDYETAPDRLGAVGFCRAGDTQSEACGEQGEQTSHERYFAA